jgi:ribonucleoside-diphosphate reductase alpha chain
MHVIKRNGKTELLDINKLHKVVRECCAGITGVSESQIEINSQIQFFDGIKTSDIQETMIKSAADLISEETPNYQYVAGRLVNHHLRKQIYGSFTPIHIFEHYKNGVTDGLYCEDLYVYSLDEWNELNNYIDHSRDMNLTYAAMEQFRGKYLAQNRVTGQIFETPQITYMLISMMLFQRYHPVAHRLSTVKRMYDALSTFDLSLPTPIMAGLRTTVKQFSSCVLIETGDSLDSILGTTNAIVDYVSQKAGIGIGAGAIRAVDSPIRGGNAVHTGVVPFYKMFEAAVKSCSQGGVRGGSATLNFPFWHLEFEDMIVLKNNKGTNENRIRKLDYCVHLHKLAYERFITGKDLTLFSPSDVPGLYDAFYENDEEFRRLYEEAEKNPNIRKKTISAFDLISTIAQERKDTGRVYIMNVDHVNSHGSFIPSQAPIKMTNLCVDGSTNISIMLDTGEIKEITIEELSLYLMENQKIMIQCRDHKFGSDVFKQVKKWFKTHPCAKVMKITDDKTGNSIICTPEHKVYTQNRGYVEAKYLTKDDELQVM